MSVLDHAETRLENLEAIEPLLGSLRVLSLSTMQMALNRQSTLKEYKDRFLQIAAFLHSKDKNPRLARVIKAKRAGQTEQEQAPINKPSQLQILAVIGSSRGICGQYNKQLAHETARLLEQETNQTGQTQVLAFGLRLQNAMRAEGFAFKPGEALSHGSLPDYDRVSGLMRGWEAALNAGEISSVSLLSFQKQGTASAYKPKLSRLLPDSAYLADSVEMEHELFPEPIVEGEPTQILERIEKHLNAIRLYDLILDAIAAENLYRYRLLEEAKENTEALVEELSISLQMERRKAITQQMQQLGVASGMLAST